MFLLLPGDNDDASSASDDETNLPSTGLMQLLRGYQSHGSKVPGPKAVAKSVVPKPVASKKASARPKAASCQASNTSSAVAMKASIGSVDSKRRKTTPAPEVSAPFAGGTGSADDMCSADKEIVDSFQTRLQDLRTVKPPLSEPQFKSYLGDLISKCNTFWSDIRTKRRSAQRRNNKDDPLPMVLDGIEESIKDHINLLKCFLTRT